MIDSIYWEHFEIIKDFTLEGRGAGTKAFNLNKDSKSVRREGKSWGGVDYSLKFGHADHLSSGNEPKTKDAQKVTMLCGREREIALQKRKYSILCANPGRSLTPR